MKQKDNADRDERYAAWVGFNWGDQEHVWALQWTDTGERESKRISTSTKVGIGEVCACYPPITRQRNYIRQIVFSKVI